MKYLLLPLLIIITLSSSASVSASFTCSDIKGCSPLVVSLTDHSGGSVTSWHWDLGNGNTSTQPNPSATYFTPGVYTVKLVVASGTNRDSSTQSIIVFSPPMVNFITDRNAACPLDSIQFTNQVTAGSAPVTQYAWGFGNGVASSDQNAAYRYAQSGIYDVTLVVQDSNGCNGHMTKPAFITIWPKPTATFTASPLISCGASQVVTFTNQSTGNGLTYIWVFNDSTYSNTASPSHQYSYGKYQPNLIIANSNGCIDSIKQKIAVIDLKADFIASKTKVCAGEAVQFMNESPMPGTTWHWNFGDGTTSIRQNPIKAYSAPGLYTVTFIVSDAICGDSNTKVAYMNVTSGFSVGFTADNRNSCTTPFNVNFTSHAPSNVSLVWSFGDGNTSTNTNASNTYNTSAAFSVTLTAVDSSGCTVVASVPAFINTSKPSVKFYCDTLFCPGVGVGFANRTNNATRYLWQFGDGDTSTQVNPTHTYRTYGRYSVSLTAWDSIGCDSTLVRPSLINIDTTTVNFNVNETFSMCPPLVSVFSSHTNRNDLKYFWDFGDGYTDATANPTHIYFHPGVYTVKLTVVNKYGCGNSVTDSNLIKVQGPSGAFTINPNTGCIPVDVSFSATPSANTQSVLCDLGDGTLYHDSLHFSHIYNVVNVFHPKFILTDAIGCSVPYSLDSIVTHPVPLISLKDTSICAGRDVKVSLGNDHYQWKDRKINTCETCLTILGNCDTCNSVILSPSDTMQYQVTATNEFGCSVKGGFKVMVAPLAVLNTQDTIKLCKNASVQMNAVDQAYKVNWSPAIYLSSTTSAQPICTPMSDINYIVTAYNRLGCASTQTVPVRVYDIIPLAISADTAVCAGASVQLMASVSDSFFHGVNYTWERSADLSNINIANPIATVHQRAETFHVIATSGSCPAATASVSVDVHQAASVKLPANMVATSYAEVSITPISGDLVSYAWSAKNQLSCVECNTTTLVPTESQIVYVEGKNQYGCSAKDSMMVHVLNCDPSSIFVPNTFTPNGDGTNDKLYVRSRTLAQLDYFRLFNRWGAVVFETKTTADGWDGNINGKLAEEGVYVYQISGKCENGYDVATSGTVTLIR